MLRSRAGGDVAVGIEGSRTERAQEQTAVSREGQHCAASAVTGVVFSCDIPRRRRIATGMALSAAQHDCGWGSQRTEGKHSKFGVTVLQIDCFFHLQELFL